MATPRAVVREDAQDESSVGSARVRLSEECLELDALSAAEVHTLRTWISRINGSINIQPYLVEDSPGRFCLYVGGAAEQARTRKGLQ
jgi:hypothetical protein